MSLEDIREQKHSKGIYIVIGLLLVGMAGFGTSQFGLGGGSAKQPLLTAGNAEISLTEYDNMLRYIQQRSPNATTEQARALAIGSLRQRVALADYISRYPFAASNRQIDEAIRDNPMFAENGSFSEEVFRRVVPVSAFDFRRSVSKDIALQELQTMIATTGVVSQAELQPYWEMQNLTRDLVVAKIARDRFTATADDAAIQAYYDAHKAEFMSSAQYDIEYIDFDPAVITDNINVSEKDIADKVTPPRRADYFIFTDTDSAQAFYEAKQSGKTLDALKSEFAANIDDSGDLGSLNKTIDKGSLISQAATDAIFALNTAGDITAPIQTDNGIMVFLLTDAGQDSTDAATKAIAKKALQQEKAAPKIAELGEKLNQAVFESGTPTLESIAEATELAVQQSGLLDSGAQQGILAIPEVLKAVSEGDQTTGKLQEPITVGERVIIYRLKTVKAPEQQPLEAVKSRVEQQLKNADIEKQMQAASKQLLEKSKTEGLQKAAQANNFPIATYKNFTAQTISMDNQQSLLDPIGAYLIAAKPPVLGEDNASEMVSPTGDIYVYVTTDVRLGKKASEENETKGNAKGDGVAKIDEEKKALEDALITRTGEVELDHFLRSVTERTEIKDHSTKVLKH